MEPQSSSARPGNAEGNRRRSFDPPLPASRPSGRLRTARPTGWRTDASPLGRAQAILRHDSALDGAWSLRLELKDAESVFAQEFRPDVIAERHVGHITEDPLER